MRHLDDRRGGFWPPGCKPVSPDGAILAAMWALLVAAAPRVQLISWAWASGINRSTTW